MAGGQDDVAGHKLFAGGQCHTGYLARLRKHVGNRAVEPDFAPMFQDGVADGLNNVGQFVGAYMGAGVYEDVGGGTMGNQLLQYRLYIAPLIGSGVQFAV